MQTNLFSRLRGLCLFFFLLTGFGPAATSQVFTASMTSTPTHQTCYSGSRLIDYTVTINPPVRSLVYGIDYTFNLSQTTFKLRTTASGAGGTVLLTNTGGTVGGTSANPAISGTFDLSAAALAPDVYTVYASVTVVYNGNSQVVQATTTVTVGYQASWASLLDMQPQPTLNSAKRTATTSGVTTARAISANKLAASTNGWIDFGAQFGGTTGTVTFVIGKTTTSMTNPTAQPLYISFNRTGASTGTVTVTSSSTTTTLTGMSYDSRVLMRRSAGVLSFYNSSGALISGAPTISYTGELNCGAFAANVNDGASNVTTSFSCVFENQFFYLKDEPEQSIAYIPASDNQLRFKYEEEYFDAAGTLNYTIRCLNDDVVPTTVTVTKPAHTNWIEIPLGSGGVAYTAGNTYLLEVKDVKGRKQYLKYKKL